MELNNKELTKVQMAQLGLEFLVCVGVDRIVSEIIKTNVPQGNVFQRTAVFAGRIGIAMTVSSMVTRNLNSQIDEVVKAVEKARADIKTQNETPN